MSGQAVSFGGLARQIVNEGIVTAEIMQRAASDAQTEKSH